MSHHSGFVNIIGKPNVGKSTLMNRLVGERLSIITSKAQTTRHRIMGIVNSEDFQIVYSDTPGILDPKYKMQEGMMHFVNSALADADILLFVSDMEWPKEEHISIVDKIKNKGIPIILVINKIDLTDQAGVEVLVDKWKVLLPEAIILPLAALHGFGTDTLLEHIIRNLPESPPFFSKEELTDKPMRFFISEIIREKILLQYKKEIPYSCEVIVQSYKDEENIVKIQADIVVSRDTQKGIIIGHNGQKLKHVGIDARKDIETFIQKKVYLELYVKVDKDWRDSEQKLKGYGYL